MLPQQQQKNRIITNSHLILELTAKYPGLGLVFDFTYIISFRILCVGLVVSIHSQAEPLVMIPRNLGSLT